METQNELGLIKNNNELYTKSIQTRRDNSNLPSSILLLQDTKVKLGIKLETRLRRMNHVIVST